jgi:ligand-binding sensor domain-containing protein
MKRFYLLVALICLIVLSLKSVQNWNIYTNITHIYDAVEIDDKLYLATWGGLVEFDIPNKIFTRTRTNIDGLSDIDIRAVDYLEGYGQLLSGTYNNGIDRLQGDDFLIPLTETIGLASNTVNEIVHNDSLIFVATKFGLSVFKLEEGFPFPLLIDNFDIDKGLSANNITSLQLSETGYLFCGSEAGIDYVQIDQLESVNAWQAINTENSPLPDNNINSLSVNSDQLAIGCRQGIARVQVPQFTDWIIYEEVVQDTFASIYPVFLDSGNNIWFSYGYWEEVNLNIMENGNIALGKLNAQGELQQWTAAQLGFPTEKIMKLQERENGQIIILTWGNSLIFSVNEDWVNYEANSVSASLVREIKIDQDQKLWTCSGYIPPESNPPLPRGTAGVSCLDDGYWYNYSADNTPLLSDNIFSIETDNLNNKWFGAWYIQSSNPYGWQDGISILNESDDSWSFITSSDGIRNNAIADLFLDDANRMWVCSLGGSNGGISVIDLEDYSIITTFDLYESDSRDPLVAHIGQQKKYFGGRFSGLRIWNDDSIPEDDGFYWSIPPFSDLQSGKINDIITIEVNGREELWVASDNGLFNLAWSTYFNDQGSFLWYKYGTVIKRKAWYNNSWFGADEPSPEFWYIEGQERIYASVPTFPTALLADPFNQIWIGSDNSGISVYDLQRDTFTNYNMSNSPLISNRITDFAYDEFSGILYIGTDRGLHSVEIGIPGYANKVTDLSKALVYPNPFYPERGEILRIENKGEMAMPRGKTECRIYDLSGDLVNILNKDVYEQFSWDGNNKSGKKCSSGVYFYVISTPDGQTLKGKIILVR